MQETASAPRSCFKLLTDLVTGHCMQRVKKAVSTPGTFGNMISRMLQDLWTGFTVPRFLPHRHTVPASFALKRALGDYLVQTPAPSRASIGFRPILPNPFKVFWMGLEGELHLARYIWSGIYSRVKGQALFIVSFRANAMSSSSIYSCKLARGQIGLKQFDQFTVKGLSYLVTSQPSSGPTATQPRNRFSASYCLDADKRWEVAKGRAEAQSLPEVFCGLWNEDRAHGSVLVVV